MTPTDSRIGWIRTTVQAAVGAVLTAGPVMTVLDALDLHPDQTAVVAVVTPAAISLWWRVGTWASHSNRLPGWVRIAARWAMGGPAPSYGGKP